MTAFKNTHPPRGRLTVSTVPAPGASPGTEPVHTGKPRTVGEDPCLLWMFSPPGSGVTFSVYYPNPARPEKTCERRTRSDCQSPWRRRNSRRPARRRGPRRWSGFHLEWFRVSSRWPMTLRTPAPWSPAHEASQCAARAIRPYITTHSVLRTCEAW